MASVSPAVSCGGAPGPAQYAALDAMSALFEALKAFSRIVSGLPDGVEELASSDLPLISSTSFSAFTASAFAFAASAFAF